MKQRLENKVLSKIPSLMRKRKKRNRSGKSDVDDDVRTENTSQMVGSNAHRVDSFDSSDAAHDSLFTPRFSEGMVGAEGEDTAPIEECREDLVIMSEASLPSSEHIPPSTVNESPKKDFYNHARDHRYESTSMSDESGRTVTKYGVVDETIRASQKSIIHHTSDPHKKSRSVTFADEAGLEICTCRIISPRGRVTIAAQQNPDLIVPQPEAAESARTSRAIILLMCPRSRQFELVNIYYDSKKRTSLRQILQLIPKFASFRPLVKQKYVGLCRSGVGRQMINSLSTSDYKFRSNEILIAIPQGVTASECILMAEPILKDRMLISLVKRARRPKASSQKLSQEEVDDAKLAVYDKLGSARSNCMPCYSYWFLLFAGLIVFLTFKMNPARVGLVRLVLLVASSENLS